jgi:hypothetical protein
MPDITRDRQSKRSASRGHAKSRPPGIGSILAVTVIAGILCWFWLVPGRAHPLKSAVPNASELTEVEPPEIEGALTTMTLSNSALVQYRTGKDGGCRRPLAWVTLVSAPGEPPSRVRLISGTYYSPVFEVTATPVRVALPFPAPYETGQGTLGVIDQGGDAAISLFPTWRVSAQDGKSTHVVTWHPVARCPSNG